MNGFSSALFILLLLNMTNSVAMRTQYLQSCSKLSLFNPDNALTKSKLSFLSRVHQAKMRLVWMRIDPPKSNQVMHGTHSYHGESISTSRLARLPQQGLFGCLISSETSYMATGWSSLTGQWGSSRLAYRLVCLTDFFSHDRSFPVARAEVGMRILPNQYIQGK